MEMSEEFKEIFERMLSLPLKSEIKIGFDLQTKKFILSVPIYKSDSKLPLSVKEYVEARRNHTFKPHETLFELDGENQVKLVQSLPFQWGYQPGLREQIVSFWKLSKHCHRVLLELAVEEKYRSALHLD